LRKQRTKTGDVVAIPLSNGQFAFGRIFNEGVLGVYATLSDSIEHPPIGARVFAFQVGVYRDILSSGVWPKVGVDLMTNSDDDWSAPMFMGSALDAIVQIYSHGVPGETVPISQVQGWSPAAVCESTHVIDMILAASQGQKSKWETTPWPVQFLDMTVPGRIQRIAPFSFGAVDGPVAAQQPNPH
jgi:hypothetical protein